MARRPATPVARSGRWSGNGSGAQKPWAPVRFPDRSPGTVGFGDAGLSRPGAPERHSARRSPTRTPPPPNSYDYNCPMDHLLFGAPAAVEGPNPPGSAGQPGPAEPRADEAARVNALRVCPEGTAAVNGNLRRDRQA